MLKDFVVLLVNTMLLKTTKMFVKPFPTPLPIVLNTTDLIVSVKNVKHLPKVMIMNTSWVLIPKNVVKKILNLIQTKVVLLT